MGGGILSNKSLDLELAGLMFAGILLFTLCWEHFSEMLEESLAKQPHFLLMLSKVYRELMILGFISLALVLSIEFAAPWIDNCDHTNLLHFEFAHLLIFFWAMVYVCNALVSVARLAQTRRSWDRIANTEVRELCHSVEESMQLSLVDDLKGSITSFRPDQLASKFLAGSGEKNWRPLWVGLLPGQLGMWEDVEWKILQRLFLRNFKLPDDFDYSKYIQQKLMEGLAESLEVKPLTWIIVISSTMGYVGIAKILNAMDDGDSHRRLGADNGADCVNASDRRRLGGSETCDPCEITYIPELDSDTAVVRIIVMLVIGWLLVLGNVYVVYFVKRGCHTLMSHQGCSAPAEMPLFLRKLDAQLQVRLQLSQIKIFEKAGSAFYAACSSKLKVQFYDPGAVLATEGQAGDSMFFIVAGTVNIVDGKTNKVLAALQTGAFAGEMSLLLGIPRSKSLICADEQNTPSGAVTIAIMDKGLIDEMSEDFPHVVDALRTTAEQRKGMSEIQVAVEGAGEEFAAPVEETTIEEHHDHQHHAAPHGAMPGMGGHSHSKGSKLKWADEILPDSTRRNFGIFTELCLLFNCFYISFYIAHMMFIAIPIAEFSKAATVVINVFLLIPPGIIMLILAPMAAKYSCLLVNVLERDDDLVAHVISQHTATIELRNKMRRQLMHHGLAVAHEKRVDPSEITAMDVAKFAFGLLDDNNCGELSYKELRRGLPELDIFLTKDEFKQICRIIDKNQGGTLCLEDWTHFMQASDDDIKNNEWENALNAVKLRGKVKAALIEPAMSAYWQMAAADAPPPTLQLIVDNIFVDLDADKGGVLTFEEFKSGLEKYDVALSVDEFKALIQLIEKTISGASNSNTMSKETFHKFMEMSDAELDKVHQDASGSDLKNDNTNPVFEDEDVENPVSNDNISAQED